MAEQRQIVDTPGASAYTGFTGSALAHWRTKGIGPRYIKVGGRVRYRLDDLDEWLDAHVREPEHAHSRSRRSVAPRRRAS